MSSFYVEFLTRRGCGLCRRAEPTVRRATRLTLTRMEVVDVEADPEMAVDWGLRIPVVRDPRGRVLAEGHIGFWHLVRRLLGARLG